MRLGPRSDVLSFLVATLMASALAAADVLGAPLVQPGAPGTPSKVITAARARDLASTEQDPADVKFMQDMMVHHAQALEMVDLIQSRSSNRELALLGRRIYLSQAGEIELMKRWLSAHGQNVPDIHVPHSHHQMSGMLSPQQMDELRSATGVAFDRLFLRGMVQHHHGALDTVEALLKTPGAADDPEISRFANGIVPDQTSEIAVMTMLLQKM